MRAAALAGGDIPKLCATDTLKAFGSCRVCLVEIEGRKGFPASCTTEVAAGMKVRTHSDALTKLRRGVLELYVSEHPMGSCPDSSRCELEHLAHEHGIGESRFAGPATARDLQTPKPLDASNPYFRFDNDLCIVCSRCVRACEDTQGTFALTIQGRGLESRVRPPQISRSSNPNASPAARVSRPVPTGALMEKSRRSAAGLPQQAVPTTCAYCGVGCSLIAEVTDGAVSRMVPNRNGRANQGHACVKGRFAYGYATHAGSRHEADDPQTHHRRMARSELGRSLRLRGRASSSASRPRYGRDSIGGITSSRCTNEETFLVQKLVRAAFGTNNVDTCARVCHSPTGYGLKHTLGESAGTQEFVSVQHADVIMVIGASPTEAHPVFASQMKRRLRSGARLIVIDPRGIPLVRSPHVEADYHLRLMPGTNVAVINALAHVVVTEGLDEGTIHRRSLRTGVLRSRGRSSSPIRSTRRRRWRRSAACRPR